MNSKPHFQIHVAGMRSTGELHAGPLRRLRRGASLSYFGLCRHGIGRIGFGWKRYRNPIEYICSVFYWFWVGSFPFTTNQYPQ